jgi:hypothetical protein
LFSLKVVQLSIKIKVKSVVKVSHGLRRFGKVEAMPVLGKNDYVHCSKKKKKIGLKPLAKVNG